MRLLSLLLLLVAGCQAALPEVFQPDVPAACHDQVFNDPAVKAAIVDANSPLAQIRMPGVAAQKQAVAVALRKCLAGRGVAPQGGVEPLRSN